jgi:hypothetical protein
MWRGEKRSGSGKNQGLSLPLRKGQQPPSVRADGSVQEVAVARGFNLKWLGRREVWASASRSTDRSTRYEPGRSGPARPPTPRCDSTEEVDELAEQWIIDDLDPLRHEEHTIR